MQDRTVTLAAVRPHFPLCSKWGLSPAQARRVLLSGSRHRRCRYRFTPDEHLKTVTCRPVPGGRDSFLFFVEMISALC